MKYLLFILGLTATIFSPLSAMNYAIDDGRTTSQQRDRDVLIERIQQLQEENQQLMQALEEDAVIMGAQDQELNHLNQQVAQGIHAEAPAVQAQNAPAPQPQATSAWTLAQRIHSANTMVNTITGRNVLRDAFWGIVGFTAKYSKFLPVVVPLLNLLTSAPTHGLTHDNLEFRIDSTEGLMRAPSRWQPERRFLI